jgi:glycosyltransferase involved in cell wall biosynthesis
MGESPSTPSPPMNNPIEISVIVPVYNAASTLAQSLEALRRESALEPACELIFVDNGSTDGSADMVRTFPGITLLHEPRRGAYAARNRGVLAARGGLLAFTDPDCIVAAGWLRAAKEALRDNGCLVALGARRPAPDEGLNRLLGDYEVTKDRWVLSGNEPVKYYGFTNTMATCRVAWERYGPFDDRLRGSDTIFVRRLVNGEGCGAVRFVDGMRVAHLEIDGPSSYLRKTFIYGRSLESYRRTITASPLTLRDRVRVFRATAREHAYGLPQASALAFLLVAGMAAWSAGRFAGRFVGRLRRR